MKSLRAICEGKAHKVAPFLVQIAHPPSLCTAPMNVRIETLNLVCRVDLTEYVIHRPVLPWRELIKA